MKKYFKKINFYSNFLIALLFFTVVGTCAIKYASDVRKPGKYKIEFEIAVTYTDSFSDTLNFVYQGYQNVFFELKKGDLEEHSLSNNLTIYSKEIILSNVRSFKILSKKKEEIG